MIENKQPQKPIDIYVYEDRDANVVYVGLSVNIKKRHSAHKNGRIQKDGSRKYDVVSSYFRSANKPFPNPIIRMSQLETKEDGQYYEGWYRDAYEKEGWIVLNIAKTGIGYSSTGGSGSERKWSESKLEEEAKRYSSRWDFGKNNGSAYAAALELGIMDKLFPETIIKPSGYWTVFENHLKEIDGCKSRKEYERKNRSAYTMAIEYGFIEKLFPSKLHKPITEEELQEAKKYKDRSELSHNNRRLYLALYKRGLLDEFYS